MFNKNHFENLIGRVILILGTHSQAAVNLLLGTAAVESCFGRNLRQLGGGPARGVFQIEPATEKDIWDNFLRYNAALRNKMIEITGIAELNLLALEGNLIYQICMARLQYYKVAEPLPGPDDIEGLAKYYKVYFNTLKGKATMKGFISKYRLYVLKEKNIIKLKYN